METGEEKPAERTPIPAETLHLKIRMKRSKAQTWKNTLRPFADGEISIEEDLCAEMCSLRVFLKDIVFKLDEQASTPYVAVTDLFRGDTHICRVRSYYNLNAQRENPCAIQE